MLFFLLGKTETNKVLILLFYYFNKNNNKKIENNKVLIQQKNKETETKANKENNKKIFSVFGFFCDRNKNKLKKLCFDHEKTH